MMQETTTISSSLVTSNQILVSHYLYERVKEVNHVVKLSNQRRNSLQRRYQQLGLSKAPKRPLGRVHYRTRSHKRYKFPRKVISKKRKSNRSENAFRCRKYRRRLSTFRDERDGIDSQKPRKLPTHNWHVKRFQMERNYYNYQVPYRRSSKALKSLEKTIVQKPLVHDYSYLEAVVIDSSLGSFLQFLSDYSDPNSSIIQELQKRGRKLHKAVEYDIMVYQKECFPEKLIGPISVSVMFGPSLHILCWLHPAIRAQVWELLQSVQNDHFIVQEKMPLARFWMSGVNIASIIPSLYYPIKDTVTNEISSPTSDPSASESEAFSFLYHCLQDQRRLQNTWKSGQVLSLPMADPRFRRSKRPTFPTPNLSDKTLSLKWPKACFDSTLWSKLRLEEVISKAPSAAEVQSTIAKEKFQKWNAALQSVQQYFGFDLSSAAATSSQHKVGTPSSHSAASIPSIPSLLIRKAASSPTHAATIPDTLINDWIIIVPRCYASAVFHHLVLRERVESLGLAEMESITRLQRRLLFPNDYPDSPTGWNYWYDCHYERWMTAQGKKPPAKRISRHSSMILALPQLVDQENHQSGSFVSQASLKNINNVDNDEGEVNLNDPNDRDVPSLIHPTELETAEEPLLLEREEEVRELFAKKFLIVRDKQYFQEVLPLRYQSSSTRTDNHSKDEDDVSKIIISNGIFQCLQHRDWQIPEDATTFPDNDNNELIPTIPPSPKPIFVFITLHPTSRGVPFTGSSLYQPTIGDLRAFIRHKVHLRLRYLQSQAKKKELSSSSHSTLVPTTSQLQPRKKKNRSSPTPEVSSSSASSHFAYDPAISREWRGISLHPDSSSDSDRVLLGVITNGLPPHSNTNAFHRRNVAIALVHLPRLHAMIREYYGRYSYSLSHQLLLFRNPTSDWLRPALYDFM